MHERLLVVDDEPVLREALAALLREVGYSVRAVGDAASALRALHDESIDLVLTDVKMADPETGRLSSRAGFDLLRKISQQYPGTPVVMITALHSIDTAVEAMQAGAANYVVKPYRRPDIKKVVAEALARGSGVGKHSNGYSPIHSRAKSMAAAIEAAARAARSNVTVLITGPQGSGKDYTARAIHSASSRSGEPFVPIALPSVPETLFEAELFGSDKGAYTGAVRLKRGAFEMAGRGTLFLDAIDETPLTHQAKLMLPLERREVRRVGGRRPIPFLARIMAASSVNLLDLLRAGDFRNDLYYALKVLPIELPALRDRMEDVPDLARIFLHEMAVESRRNLTITESAVDLLQSYEFPGNIRELRNLIQSSSTLAQSGEITSEHIRKALELPAAGSARVSTIHHAKRTAERERILLALAHHPKDLGSVARELGVSRTTLWRKMREHELAARGEASNTNRLTAT